MLIDFKQFPRVVKFISLLKLETFVQFNVQFKFLTRSFSITSAVRSASCYLIKTFHTICLLSNLFFHIYVQAQGAIPSYTQNL